MTNILGISAFYHDSAACLVRDGEIVAAAQEERFSRKKGDAAFPKNAIAACLKIGEIEADDLDYVGFYDKPLIKFERLLSTYMETVPTGFDSFVQAMPGWMKKKLWLRRYIEDKLGTAPDKIIFLRHHEAHAASAFFPSPFKRAAILTMDGVGEWTTSSSGLGDGNWITLREEMRFPHSLGLLYSAFTYYTGFKVNSGEYKVMGLAPYGKPKYTKKILDNLIDLKTDGSFHLNLKYFNFLSGLTMTNENFHHLFGGLPRKPETKLAQKQMDLAKSIQEVAEEIILRQGKHVYELTQLPSLCLAGGVALNCVANGRLLREGPFGDIWIQPAAGDAGGALGTALFIWHQYLEKPRQANGKDDTQKASLLGPTYSVPEIKQFLDQSQITYDYFENKQKLAEKIARVLAQGKVVGFFQGPMEFGPRALGDRSILGDARSAKMQRLMNLKIKFRESFRPFAPIVMEEDAAKYFEIDRPSPYMLLVAFVNQNRRQKMTKKQEALFGIDKLNVPRSDIPAVTHIDYSARLQTVNQQANPYCYEVIRQFKRLTGYSVLVNTSFNVRGEPIVCSPQDAYVCFRRTKIDYLVLENFWLDKKQMKAFKDDDWRTQFKLD
jgi:carbamoyltransferase